MNNVGNIIAFCETNKKFNINSGLEYFKSQSFNKLKVFDFNDFKGKYCYFQTENGYICKINGEIIQPIEVNDTFNYVFIEN